MCGSSLPSWLVIFIPLIDYKLSHLCLQARRHAEFMALKQQIIVHMEELDHVPETSFEKDVVCEDEESFCLSRENITSLKLLICHVSLTFCPCGPAPKASNSNLKVRLRREHLHCLSGPSAGGT